MAGRGRPRALNEKMKFFCREYILNNGNRRQAAIKAGYSKKPNVADAQGRRLEAMPQIIKYLAELRKEVLDKFSTDLDSFLAPVSAIVNFDAARLVWPDDDPRKGMLKQPHELDKATRLCIAEMEFDKTGTKVIHYKIISKLGAMEIFGRAAGLFEVDNKQKQPGAPALDKPDRDKILAEIRKQAGALTPMKVAK
jgi:hypothetical protein